MIPAALLTSNADRDLTSQVTVVTGIPDASNARWCQVSIRLGDGAKNLDGSGGLFEITIENAGQTVQPDPQYVRFSTAVRSMVVTQPFHVTAGATVTAKVKSPNGADTDVDVTATVDGVLGQLDALTSSRAAAAKMLAYVQLLARSDAAIEGDLATELGEINADEGSGAGNYSGQTDSGEAIRDQGDSAYLTATGFLDAAGVRTAIGMGSANLDTQLADIPTVAEFEARSIVSADYFVVGDYTAPLDAAGIRTAVGLGSANLDTQLGDIPTVAEFEARSIVAADYFVVGDYTAPLSAAGIRSAVGLASANLDTQLADIPTVAELNARTLVAASYFNAGSDEVTTDAASRTASKATGFAVPGDEMALEDDAITAAKIAANAIGASELATDAVNEIADALLDRASAIDGKTPRQALRYIAAGLAGKISGAGTGTEIFVGIDASTTRFTVTTDASGNRTAVTYDA
tara:strand:+ start:1751 stop:3136 length:1386 start_codon:yes stop_codon:yes gene_type:complete